MKLFLLILVTITLSCSHKVKEIPPAPILKENVTNRELWLNRSGDELLLHPIFASLPLVSRKTTTGIEVKSFRNSGGTRSDQSCSITNYYTPSTGNGGGYGNCSDTRYEIECSHIFYIKNNSISDYKRVGQCYGDRYDFRPLDKDGIPVITVAEKNYLSELEKYNLAISKADCNKNSDCSDGMSCSNNKCQSLGIWGRVFNP